MRQTKQKASKYPLLKALTAPIPQPIEWVLLDEISHHLFDGGSMIKEVRRWLANGEYAIEAIKLDEGLRQTLEADDKIQKMCSQTWSMAQTFKSVMEDDIISHKLSYYTYSYNGFIYESIIFPDNSEQVERAYKFITYTLVTQGGDSVLACAYVTFNEGDDPLAKGNIETLTIAGVRSLLGVSPYHDDKFNEGVSARVSTYSIKNIVGYKLWKELFQETITTYALPVHSKKANLGFKINKQFKVTMLLDRIEDRRTLIGQFIRDSHIRLQRYGKGNRLVKPVLIKSTTVKAHTRK